jgi:hypothetical protein
MSPEEVLQHLRRLANADLGPDPAAWRVWWRQELFRHNIDQTYVDHLLFPEELLLRRIEGRLPPTRELDWLRPVSPEECFAELRARTGQALGTDLAAWREWWQKEEPHRYLDNVRLLEPYTWSAEELLIRRLQGQVPPDKEFNWLRRLSEEDALQELRRRTGRDLGPDPAAWIQWWEAQPAQQQPTPQPRRRLFIDPERYRSRKGHRR